MNEVEEIEFAEELERGNRKLQEEIEFRVLKAGEQILNQVDSLALSDRQFVKNKSFILTYLNNAIRDLKRSVEERYQVRDMTKITYLIDNVKEEEKD